MDIKWLCGVGGSFDGRCFALGARLSLTRYIPLQIKIMFVSERVPNGEFLL